MPQMGGPVHGANVASKVCGAGSSLANHTSAGLDGKGVFTSLQWWQPINEEQTEEILYTKCPAGVG